MKKHARLVSAIALTLALIICFSSCGLVDYTRSLVQKNDGSSDTEVVDDENQGDDLSDTDSVTDTDVVAPGTTGVTEDTTVGTSDTTATSQSTDKPAGGETGNTNTGANSGTNTKPGTGTGTNTKPGTGSTTTQSKPGTDSTKPSTSNPGDDKPVKYYQDLLFATEDPTTAGKILQIAGFEYDAKQGIYYSQMNPLQRKFGFNLVYDMAAPMTGMFYDTKRIEFNYDNREWMIQIWKGQYGITAGAEIGLYNRDPERNFQYDCADDEDLIEMQFDFYNMNEFVFSRGPEKHWWLTGFKVFHSGVPMLIDLDMTLKFTNNQMADAFYKSLKKTASTTLVDPIKCSRQGTTVHIEW